MASFLVEGGHPLIGDITPQGAKNEALQVVCATLLTGEEVKISNIPEILDVANLIDLLRQMGVRVDKTAKGEYTFCADRIDENYVGSEEFASRCAKLRGSVMLTGPLWHVSTRQHLQNQAATTSAHGVSTPICADSLRSAPNLK